MEGWKIRHPSFHPSIPCAEWEKASLNQYKGLYDQKCELLFQHIYESYAGGESSIYAVAA